MILHYWPVRCIKTGGHDAVLSGPTVIHYTVTVIVTLFSPPPLPTYVIHGSYGISDTQRSLTESF